MLFDTSQAQLEPVASRSVDRLAGLFERTPTRNALVEGFIDSTGSEGANLDLSDRRAVAVRTALVERGIGSKLIAVHGHGQASPVASNESAGCRR